MWSIMKCFGEPGSSTMTFKLNVHSSFYTVIAISMQNIYRYIFFFMWVSVVLPLVAAVIHRLLLCRATFSYPGSQQLWVLPQSSFRDFKLVFALNRHSRAWLCWYETLIRRPETEAAAFGYTDSYQSLVAFLLFSGDIKGVCHVCWCHSDTDSFWQGRRDERTKARACLSPF